ncbi:hypothetical protein Tco_0511059 [Tanacetum coccineum]
MYSAYVRRIVADFLHAPPNEYSPSPNDKKQEYLVWFDFYKFPLCTSMTSRRLFKLLKCFRFYDFGVFPIAIRSKFFAKAIRTRGHNMYLIGTFSNRLENLLVQGKQDRDFLTNEALQPVLKLLSGPEGKELRTLVIKEAIRVTEENTIGIMVDTYNSIPAPLKTFIPNGNGIGTPLTNAEIVPD